MRNYIQSYVMQKVSLTPILRLTFQKIFEDLIPLTSAMFLQKIRETGGPKLQMILIQISLLIDVIRVKKRFFYRQKIREDLTDLGQFRNFSRKKKETQLKEGYVVLIGDGNFNRINWPVGKIEAIYPCKDSKTRVVRVNTRSGSYLRPVSILCKFTIMRRKCIQSQWG